MSPIRGNRAPQEYMNHHYVRYQAARFHIRQELERVFRELFYDSTKSEWKHSDLKTTIQFTKRQQSKDKKSNGMDTSA